MSAASTSRDGAAPRDSRPTGPDPATRPVAPRDGAPAELAAPGPQVSVIVSFYNATATLKRCLNAVTRQSYRNLDIIFIDDGSTDGAHRVVEAASQADPRVRLVRKGNSGVSDSRNLGLDLATGEYVYFCDADDVPVREAVETFVNAALDYGCDLVISDFYRASKGLVSHKHGPASGRFTTVQFLRYMGRRPADHYYSSLWNKLFRRSLIAEGKLRFDTSISFGEDHVFILRYLRLVRTVALVARPLYYYIDTEGSLIHRGLSVPGIVKMKWDTYLPYLRLFNDFGLYHGLERPRVYKFIGMPAMDHFVDKGDAPFEPDELFKGLDEELPERASDSEEWDAV